MATAGEEATLRVVLRDAKGKPCSAGAHLPRLVLAPLRVRVDAATGRLFPSSVPSDGDVEAGSAIFGDGAAESGMGCEDASDALLEKQHALAIASNAPGEYTLSYVPRRFLPS